MANRWGNNGNSERLFLGAPKSLQMIAALKLKDACSLEEKAMTSLDSILKSREMTWLTKCLSSQSYGFSSSHVWMDVRVGL